MQVGIMLPMGSDESGGFGNLRALAVTAEAEGLDSVWVADHLLFREGDRVTGLHEAWTVLAAIAAVTSRVTLGPLVLAVPFRNPVLTAKMALELDEISAGRFVLGLGCGWHEPEFEAMGIPFDHRVGRFEEALRIIVPLLRGETVTFEGDWYRVAGAVLDPPAVRAGGPPLLIAGERPRMLRLVAEHAALWNAAWYGRPETADELRDRLRDLRTALGTIGRDPATLDLTVGIEVDLGDGDAGERAIGGSTQGIADALAGYADLGISQLIAHVSPRTPDAIARFAEAVTLTRARLGA
ncbi:MAG: LLM class flavin-dependent oxidoreductase [Chloroflexi bacterium]|nr:LLM class flavin-dependent oxidoreductase [Chloroflexota bacterium]